MLLIIHLAGECNNTGNHLARLRNTRLTYLHLIELEIATIVGQLVVLVQTLHRIVCSKSQIHLLCTGFTATNSIF